MPSTLEKIAPASGFCNRWSLAERIEGKKRSVKRTRTAEKKVRAVILILNLGDLKELTMRWQTFV